MIRYTLMIVFFGMNIEFLWIYQLICPNNVQIPVIEGEILAIECEILAIEDEIPVIAGEIPVIAGEIPEIDIEAQQPCVKINTILVAVQPSQYEIVG